MHQKEKNLTENYTTPMVTEIYTKNQSVKVWEISRLCPETSTKLYFHEFLLRNTVFLIFLTLLQIIKIIRAVRELMFKLWIIQTEEA